MVIPPEAAMIVTALPVCGLAALMVGRESQGRRIMPMIPVVTIACVGLVSWIWTAPRAWHETFVLMPNAPNSFEAKYFRNYIEALRFAGIKASQAMRPEDVSTGSLLLLPWSTSPFTTEADNPLAKRIGELARERRWTVVVAGEHTNMGGSMERLEAMAGQPILRRDLTVPPGNTDHSGPLHVSDLRAWPHDAILNRGASVRVKSLVDKVLLAGDGWWAEPDIDEWLWVGDYTWHQRDRGGRLALAVSSDIDGARWVVVGDNSPLINSQIYADPRPMIRLLEMATLWPAFLRDCLAVAMALLLCIRFPSLKWRSWSPFIALGSLAVIAAIVSSIEFGRTIGWRDLYIGESGFDERNFNVTLVNNPAFVNGRRLIRMKEPVSGSFRLPEGDSLVFMLINGTAEVNGVKLSRCRRMGSFSTVEGPYLMDAQACQVDGAARILIGTPEGAAACVLPNASGETYVVLDIGFLAQRAPDTNTRWLLQEITQ